MSATITAADDSVYTSAADEEYTPYAQLSVGDSQSTSYTPLSTFQWNPLTTAFSPPSDCSGVYSINAIYQANTAWTCFPSGFRSESDTFFSPGLICPDGYTQQCFDSNGVSTITTVTCCPILEGGLSLTCLGDPSTLVDNWKSLFCTWSPGSDSIISVPVTLSENTRISKPMIPFSGTGGINAYGIRMVYQKTDIQSTATHSTATQSVGTQSMGTGSASNNDGGLSTSSKVAIGVSIPIAVISLMSALLFIWLIRRRRNKETARDAANQDGGAGAGDGGVCAQDPVKLTHGYAQVLPYEPPTELEQPRHELHIQTQPVELSGQT